MIISILTSTNISDALKTYLVTISDTIYLINHFLKKYGSIKRKWRKDLWKGKLCSGRNSQLEEKKCKVLPKWDYFAEICNTSKIINFNFHFVFYLQPT